MRIAVLYNMDASRLPSEVCRFIDQLNDYYCHLT